MIFIVDLINLIKPMFPDLESNIKKAKLNQKPEDFIKKSVNVGLFFSTFSLIISFFILSTLNKNLLVLIPIFIVSFFIIFFIIINSPIVTIKKRQRELDKEILFAGRFLQIKLKSGKPLLNCLIEVSNGYGVCGKYFKEITDDINMGKSIEKALENAMIYSPSDKMKRILFQINNSLKIGIDVGESLDRTLNEITKEQINDIRIYTKKLNSLSLFYLMLAIVVPAIGTAIVVVIGALIGLLTDDQGAKQLFYAICILIIILQFIFIAVFKNTRLTVNI
ncbi:MAG: type II secretion system F family protein [Nanoarchaeota archaeon]